MLKKKHKKIRGMAVLTVAFLIATLTVLALTVVHSVVSPPAPKPAPVPIAASTCQ